MAFDSNYWEAMPGDAISLMRRGFRNRLTAPCQFPGRRRSILGSTATWTGDNPDLFGMAKYCQAIL